MIHYKCKLINNEFNYQFLHCTWFWTLEKFWVNAILYRVDVWLMHSIDYMVQLTLLSLQKISTRLWGNVELVRQSSRLSRTYFNKCFCLEVTIDQRTCLWIIFRNLYVSFYKKNFYKKMSFKNAKTLRKCLKNL